MGNFSQNLTLRLKELGLTQEDVADALGVSQQTVSNWVSGESHPRASRYGSLEKLLKCDISHLLSNKKTSGSNVSDADILRYVPLISWVQAGNWSEVTDPYQPGYAEEEVPVTKKVGEHAYALRVTGDSMEPMFPPGSIIVADPDLTPENGSYVIVRLTDESEATFKQLVIDGDKRFLKPLNSRYPILEITENAVFCGVVRQMHINFP